MDKILKQYKDNVDKARYFLNEAESLYNDRALVLVREAGKIPQHHRVALGNWDCATSPTGKCAYDMTDLNRHRDDECIFCGAPDERK